MIQIENDNFFQGIKWIYKYKYKHTKQQTQTRGNW